MTRQASERTRSHTLTPSHTSKKGARTPRKIIWLLHFPLVAFPFSLSSCALINPDLAMMAGRARASIFCLTMSGLQAHSAAPDSLSSTMSRPSGQGPRVYS